MSGQQWVAPIPPFHTADGAAVTASAAITELTPLPQVQLPAGTLQEYEGKRLEITAWGHYTTTVTQGTITIGLYSGTIGQAITAAAAVAVTPALTWVASQTNRFWHIEGNVVFRTLGTAGTSVGFIDCANFVSGATDVAGVIGGTAAGGTVAVDTTVARYLALGVTLSVASQSITCRYFGVRLVN